MELVNGLQLDDARLVSLTSYPSEQGPKCVLVVAATLMPSHAEALNCAYVYRDGVPVADLDKASIDGKLYDMQLLLPNASNLAEFDTYQPELIYKFAIRRVADAKYEVSFRIHETGRRADLEALLTALNKETFSISMSPRQASLGFEGGTRVEMGDAADRSYENKSVKRGRGRPRKEQLAKEDENGPRLIANIDEPKTMVADAEWNAFYDNKNGSADPESLDILDEVIA